MKTLHKQFVQNSIGKTTTTAYFYSVVVLVVVVGLFVVVDVVAVLWLQGERFPSCYGFTADKQFVQRRTAVRCSSCLSCRMRLVKISRSGWQKNEQTDGRTDEQDPSCGVLVQSPNKLNHQGGWRLGGRA